MKRIALWTAAVIGGCGVALAQTPAPAPTPMPPAAATPATPATPPSTTGLVPGANSFTEGQARSWIEKAGYTDVTGLMKSEDGIWKGSARKGGAMVNVAVDFKGNVTVR